MPKYFGSFLHEQEVSINVVREDKNKGIECYQQQLKQSLLVNSKKKPHSNYFGW